jgi:gamma-glutamyl hercynylcysteine S-oxide synthase
MLEALERARQRGLSLIGHLGDAQLTRVVDPIMSPLAWDVGHIAAYEDLWIGHRLGGLPLLHEELSTLYDAFETPRAVRGDLEFLRGEELSSYLADVRARTVEVTVAHGVADTHELVLRHELQHHETMLQTMALGDMLPPGWGRPAPVGGDDEWTAIAGGTDALGADDDGFAYDNERPRHAVEVAPFRIATHPVANATWLAFAAGGGYAQRGWWSDEGWAWRRESSVDDAPSSVRSADPHAPVVHISWHEADAVARWSGARLPTEAEWETAATAGRLAGIGRVWEWTSSAFAAYPGFRPYPYPEYSEPFFGARYRVLRGGSCVTHPRVASLTFRNWDLPQRRQLFAGVRLAQDA